MIARGNKYDLGHIVVRQELKRGNTRFPDSKTKGYHHQEYLAKIIYRSDRNPDFDR